MTRSLHRACMTRYLPGADGTRLVCAPSESFAARTRIFSSSGSCGVLTPTAMRRIIAAGATRCRRLLSPARSLSKQLSLTSFAFWRHTRPRRPPLCPAPPAPSVFRGLAILHRSVITAPRGERIETTISGRKARVVSQGRHQRVAPGTGLLLAISGDFDRLICVVTTTRLLHGFSPPHLTALPQRTLLAVPVLPILPTLEAGEEYERGAPGELGGSGDRPPRKPRQVKLAAPCGGSRRGG